MEVKTNLTHKIKDNQKKINPTGILVLEDGTFFRGYGFGFEGIVTGEVCFNTSITGYQEIITDPSYASQIINFTFPHIGNVGTNNEDNESDKIWAKGVIFNSDITSPSNYRSIKNLDTWLKKNKIVFAGIDLISGYLTGDINITSPTGLKNYKDLTGINLAVNFWNYLEN